MRPRSHPRKAAQRRLEDNGSPGHTKTKMVRSRRTETYMTRTSVTNAENGATFRTSVKEKKEIERRRRNKRTTRRRGDQKTSQDSKDSSQHWPYPPSAVWKEGDQLP